MARCRRSSSASRKRTGVRHRGAGGARTCPNGRGARCERIEQGNHGEDVKDYWWYLDATPTSSWLQWRYHYPRAEFPYEQLRQVNGARSRHDPEFELKDTGIFDEGRYWW